MHRRGSPPPRSFLRPAAGVKGMMEIDPPAWYFGP